MLLFLLQLLLLFVLVFALASVEKLAKVIVAEASAASTVEAQAVKW